MSDDPNFCNKHFCNKTWMISSSFCPKCEAESHGEAGTIEPAVSPWEELQRELDALDDAEKTQPLGSDPTDPNGFQIINPSTKLQQQWEASYGAILGCRRGLTSSAYTIDTTKCTLKMGFHNVCRSSFPPGWNLGKWHPAYAEMFPL